jgi:hypothetical protein
MYLLFGVLAALNIVPNADADDDESQLTLNYFAKYGVVQGPELVYDITRFNHRPSPPPCSLTHPFAEELLSSLYSTRFLWIVLLPSQLGED